MLIQPTPALHQMLRCFVLTVFCRVVRWIASANLPRRYSSETLTAKAAVETVECAMELVGGASFFRDLGLERAFRDVQGARFHPLQEMPQLELTGRVALGMGIDG